MKCYDLTLKVPHGIRVVACFVAGSEPRSPYVDPSLTNLYAVLMVRPNPFLQACVISINGENVG